MYERVKPPAIMAPNDSDLRMTAKSVRQIKNFLESPEQVASYISELVQEGYVNTAAPASAPIASGGGGGGVTDGDKGDITVSGGGTVWIVDSGAVAYSELSGVPATFAPSAHTHPQSDVTNLVSDLAGKAASVHTHAQADVTNLVADLAGKAASVHTHAAADISDSTAAGRSMLTAATATAQTALLDLASATAKGLAPIRSGTATTYLDGSGAYSTPAGAATNLTYTAGTRLLESSTGADVTLPLATTSDAGLMASTDKTKLDGVATGATANSSDATLLARANHTGTQAITTILAAATARFFGRITAASGPGEEMTGTQATTLLDVATTALKGLMSSADKTKLDGVATGATATTTLDTLTDVVIATPAIGQVLAHDGTDWDNRTYREVTLGPWIFFNVPASATTAGQLPYFATATTVASLAGALRMEKAGRIVGATMIANAAVTGGTATVQASINGAAAAAILGGACQINSTAGTTLSDSAFVAFSAGAAFTAGQTISPSILTASLAPITLEMLVWLTVQFDPF